mgnify:CR=1 FL=1
MRERGLKRPNDRGSYAGRHVAPHAGAWIETVIGIAMFSRRESLPMRERGLKHGHKFRCCNALGVAPHAGAWIETKAFAPVRLGSPVAPHVGAWIETNMRFQ